MLRLCWGDNLYQRSWLPSLLLNVSKNAEALDFVKTWTSDAALEGRIPPAGSTRFAPPSSMPLSSEHVKRLSGWGSSSYSSAHMYSGALAAFKLYGDCELARQYLRLGIKANPHICVKILGWVKRPSTSRSRPFHPTPATPDQRYMFTFSSTESLDSSMYRELGNSNREDARDYLFLMSDLWMELKVWDWVSGVDGVRGKVMRPCTREACDNVEREVQQFKRCAACREVCMSVFCPSPLPPS